MKNYAYLHKLCLAVLIGIMIPAAGGCRQDNTSSQSVQTGILGDGSQTLTMWYMDSYADRNVNAVQSVQEMEKYTGVHIEYQIGNYNNMQESYLLMLSSGDIPDMIFHGDGFEYPGGGNKAIDDGVYLDMSTYVEQFMPNYQALITADPELEQLVKTDTGQMWSIYMLRCTDEAVPTAEKQSSGLCIRGDWLNDLGLEPPETIAEWEEVLTAFKEVEGCTDPLMIGKDGVILNDAFLTAYGVLSEFYVDDTGQIAYGPVQPEYREWLELFAEWYQKGLICKEFPLIESYYYGDPLYMSSGKSGAGGAIWGRTQQYYYKIGQAEDPDFCLIPLANPVLEEGMTPQSGIAHYVAECSVGVSANTENPELVAKWLDLQYTREAMLINCYGVEGESYQIDENGEIVYTDLILSAADPSLQLSEYARGDGPGLVSWERYKYADIAFQSEDVWQQNRTDLCVPELSLTTEEGSEFEKLYTGLKEYVQTQTVRFITGQISLDTEWNNYLQTVSNMGIERCLQIKNNAMNRMNG